MNRTVTEHIGKYKFRIYPTVFNPRDFLSSELFAEFVSGYELEGKDILDMGSGSGVVSVFAASKGAVCTAIDINPMAIRSVEENSVLNGFGSKIHAIESDLYDNKLLEGKCFDIIFFNPPYYKGLPKNNFERAFKGGPNLEVVKNFSEKTKDRLKPGGMVYLILSSDLNIDEFKDIFSGYNFEIVTKYNKFFETFYICKLVVN
jgi:release factor glutamine methyltransferase